MKLRHAEDASFATRRDADGNVVVHTWCMRWVRRAEATLIAHLVTCDECRRLAKL